MTTLLRIPSASFRKIEVPEAGAQGKMGIAVVNIKDIPKELDEWREVNPREVNLNSGVSKQIRKTLEENPEEFILRNRGITLIVAHSEFDNRTNTVNIELDNKEINGVLDGGHTLMNIRKYLEEEVDPSIAYVRIEILEGIGDLDQTVKIVDARNRSTEVKIASLENLLGHFDSLKDVLNKQSYSDKIAYKENELAEDGTKKEVSIEEILAYVLCFDAEDFDHTKHPIKAYSGKASVVKHYRDGVEKMKKYFSLAPEILKLRDMIYEELPIIWNEVGNDGQGGKFGKLVGVKPLKEPKILPFSGNESPYVIPSGFIYPTLAGFRALVLVEGEKVSWKDNPFKVYESIKEELAKKVAETAKRTGNPNQMGKDPNFWQICYSTVEREVLTRKL